MGRPRSLTRVPGNSVQQPLSTGRRQQLYIMHICDQLKHDVHCGASPLITPARRCFVECSKRAQIVRSGVRHDVGRRQKFCHAEGHRLTVLIVSKLRVQRPGCRYARGSSLPEGAPLSHPNNKAAASNLPCMATASCLELHASLPSRQAHMKHASYKNGPA